FLAGAIARRPGDLFRKRTRLLSGVEGLRLPPHHSFLPRLPLRRPCSACAGGPLPRLLGESPAPARLRLDDVAGPAPGAVPARSGLAGRGSGSRREILSAARVLPRN